MKEWRGKDEIFMKQWTATLGQRSPSVPALPLILQAVSNETKATDGLLAARLSLLRPYIAIVSFLAARSLSGAAFESVEF